MGSKFSVANCYRYYFAEVTIPIKLAVSRCAKQRSFELG